MIPGVGPMELVVIGGIVTLLFGAKRIPELGKSLGKGIREFQGAMKEIGKTVNTKELIEGVEAEEKAK